MDVPSEIGAVLSLDYGRRRVGVAVTDATRAFIFSRPTLEGADRLQLIADLRRVVGEDGVGLLVVGYPLNADGSEGPMCREAAAFAAELGPALGLRVAFVDERYTSLEADEMLTVVHPRDSRRRRELQDQRAAALILRTFLESGAHPGPAQSSLAPPDPRAGADGAR